MINYKTVIFSIVLGSLLLTGCSYGIVYRPEINQGNYLTLEDMAKLELGMTKEQVVYLLGTPMLTSEFGDNNWYYVFRKRPTHGAIEQQKLILTFDQNNQLIDMSGSE